MNIHEYQAKHLFQKHGIAVPDFFVVSSLEELESLIEEKGLKSAVLKVQIHAGGRGKGGGVILARTPEEILEGGKKLLGKTIITPQTGPQGLIAHALMISPLIKYSKEYYLSLTISRGNGKIVIIASPIGGVDIEKVAAERPEKVLFLDLPIDGIFRPFHLLRLAKFMGWKKEEQFPKITAFIKGLVKVFKETDSLLLEINPLVETEEGDLLPLDAKVVIDDNALYRHPDLKELFDETQVNKSEALAHRLDLAYVSLDGNIGCMVNGAGLAMATMDIIQHFGGSPANFLDVGGGASEEKVSEGFKIILSDPKVKVIFVNIFGGIMDCETLASGIISGVKNLQLELPLVVRLEGTNSEKGKELLNRSNLNIISVADLNEGAREAVKLSQRRI
jgi:succinyl-CoA synthetase beta subunit